MNCIHCHAELKLQDVQTIPDACPQCKAARGYRLYEFKQTDAGFDRNHKAEVKSSLIQPVQRQHYTGGMCFASTLLWMAFRKESGIKDLEVFRRKYVADRTAQKTYYVKFLELMGKQDGYIGKYFSSFDHFINYEVKSGPDENSLKPASAAPRFRLACGACGSKGAWTAPKTNTMIGKICGSCGKPGRIAACVDCPDCKTAVEFTAPGATACAKCNTLVVIEPAAACRSIGGQVNHNVAHRKKRSVYRKIAAESGLVVLDYENGFCFNSVGPISSVMFSRVADQPVGYVGVFGFEGDNGHSHVTSFWVRKGWVGFFDPNFGEFIFPSRGCFETWLWQHLTTDHWVGDAVDYRQMHDGWYVGLFA